MNKIKAISFMLLIIAVLNSFLLSLTGCTVIWHDDVFIGTLFKEVDANDLDMIAEPNYLQIGSGDSRTKNDKIKASTVVGGVPVIIESK